MGWGMREGQNRAGGGGGARRGGAGRGGERRVETGVLLTSAASSLSLTCSCREIDVPPAIG